MPNPDGSETLQEKVARRKAEKAATSAQPPAQAPGSGAAAGSAQPPLTSTDLPGLAEKHEYAPQPDALTPDQIAQAEIKYLRANNYLPRADITPVQSPTFNPSDLETLAAKHTFSKKPKELTAAEVKANEQNYLKDNDYVATSDLPLPKVLTESDLPNLAELHKYLSADQIRLLDAAKERGAKLQETVDELTDQVISKQVSLTLANAPTQALLYLRNTGIISDEAFLGSLVPHIGQGIQNLVAQYGAIKASKPIASLFVQLGFYSSETPTSDIEQRIEDYLAAPKSAQQIPAETIHHDLREKLLKDFFGEHYKEGAKIKEMRAAYVAAELATGKPKEEVKAEYVNKGDKLKEQIKAVGYDKVPELIAAVTRWQKANK